MSVPHDVVVLKYDKYFTLFGFLKVIHLIFDIYYLPDVRCIS
jgi:hypothetical protein